MDPITYAYTGEAMLIRWSENHNGRTVTLQLDPNIGDIHPFKGLRGGLNGQRMQLAAVLIGDDEQPLAPTKPSTEPVNVPLCVGPSDSGGEGRESRRTYTRSQMAAIKCADETFSEWLLPNLTKVNVAPGMTHKEAWQKATDIELKRVLCISSKKELDTDPAKAEDWEKLLCDFDNRAHIR